MSWFPSLRAIGGTRGTGPRSKAGPLTLVDLKSGASRLIESFPYDYGKILASSDVVNGLLSAPLTVEEKSKKVSTKLGEYHTVIIGGVQEFYDVVESVFYIDFLWTPLNLR